MLDTRDLDVLRTVQSKWQAEGSLDKGLQDLVKMPGTDRLFDRRSLLGWVFYTFSLEAPKGRLEAVRRVAFSALKASEEQKASLQGLLDPRFLEELTQHKFRWIASGSLSPKKQVDTSSTTSSVLDSQIQKVQEIAKRKWQGVKVSLKSRLESVFPTLLALPVATCPFSSKEIEQLLDVEEALTGHKDAERWLDDQTQAQEWSRLTQAVEANRAFDHKLSENGDFNLLLPESKRLSQLVEQLAPGESTYAHLAIGSHNFWNSKAWNYLRDHFGIDTGELEEKLAAIVQSGKLPQMHDWLDKLFDDLLPKELNDAIDTATAPIHLAHQIAGPLLPDRTRKVELLHALFPAFVAEFLESKAQGGVAGVLGPVLPGGVGQLSQLLTSLPIDATHTLSQSLRQQSQSTLETLAKGTIGVLADQAQSLLKAPDQWMRYFPDQTYCREAFFKKTNRHYQTPASVLIKIYRHEQGHFEVTVISSGATVGSYHPKTSSEHSCPFYFPKVSQEKLDSSFFHRLLQWGHASHLGLDLRDESVFYRQFLTCLGPYKALNSVPLEPDSLPYFNIERAMQIMGKPIAVYKKRTQLLRLQALSQLCQECQLSLRNLDQPLSGSAYAQIGRLIQAILDHSDDLESNQRPIIEALQVLQERLNDLPASQSSSKLNLFGYRHQILDSMNRHPVLLKWLLGDKADEICESLITQLGLEGEVQKPSKHNYPSWLDRNKGFLLEVLYASAIVLLAYTTGLIVSALHISATAAFSLLTRYLAARFDWQQVLPKEIHEFLQKIKKIYDDAWVWVLLKVREIFVAIARLAVEHTDSLKALKNSLYIIESARENLLHFLQGVDPVIDPQMSLQPQPQSRRMGASSTNNINFLPTQTGGFYFTGLNPDLDSHPLAKFSRFTPRNREKHKNEILIDMRSVPFSDPTLHAFLQTEKGREEFLESLQLLLKYHVSTNTRSINDWELKATCFLWMQQVLSYQSSAEHPQPIGEHDVYPSMTLDSHIVENLLDDFALSVSEKGDLRLESAFQGEHLQKLWSKLSGKVMSLEEIEQAISRRVSIRRTLASLSVKSVKMPPTLSSDRLKGLPFVRDTLLPPASKSLLSAALLRSTLPYRMTGGVDKKYEIGYAWVKVCRKWLYKNPETKELLAQIAQEWLEGQTEVVQAQLKACIDQETLMLFVFNEVFHDQEEGASVFQGKKIQLAAIRLQIRLDPIPQLALALNETKKETSKLHVLLDEPFISSDPDVFARKCRLVSRLIPDWILERSARGLANKLHVDDVGAYDELILSLIEDYELSRFLFDESIKFESIKSGNERDTESLEEARQAVMSSSRTRALARRDVQSSYLDSWTRLASMLSFLSAHPTSLVYDDDFRAQVEKLIESFFTISKSSIEDASVLEGAATCWQKLWRAAPSSFVYRHWLLAMGFKLESRLKSRAPKLNLGLVEAVETYYSDLLQYPLSDHLQNVLATLHVKIAFHPAITADSSQRLRALEAYLMHPVPKQGLSELEKSRLKDSNFSETEVNQTLKGKFKLSSCDELEASGSLLEFLDKVPSKAWQAILHRVASTRLGRTLEGRWLACPKPKSHRFFIPKIAAIDLEDNRVQWLAQDRTTIHPLDQACDSQCVFRDLGISNRANWIEEIQGIQWRCGRYLYKVDNKAGQLYYEADDKKLLAYNPNLNPFVNCAALSIWKDQHPIFYVFGDEKRAHLQAQDGAYALLKEEHNTVICLTFSTKGVCQFMANGLPPSLRCLSLIDDKNWMVSQDKDGTLLDLKHMKSNLHFALKDGTLYEMGKFKGYRVASKQASYATRMPWHAYLILENDKGEKLALTPKSSQLPSAMSRFILPDIPILNMLSYLFSTYISDSLLNPMLDILSKDNPVFVYTLTEDNQLESCDFSSLFHLFTSYSLQRRHEKSERVLRQIEQWLAGPLESKINDRDLFLLCVDFESTPMKILRIRLAIALAQRQMTQASVKVDRPQLQVGRLALTAICLKDYNSLLQQGDLRLNQLGLDVRDELALVEFSRGTQSELIDYLAQEGYLLKKDRQSVLGRLQADGLATAIECSLYPELVWKRAKLLEDWRSKTISSSHPIQWQRYVKEAYDNVCASYTAVLSQFQRFSIQYLDGARAHDIFQSVAQKWMLKSKNEISIRVAHNCLYYLCRLSTLHHDRMDYDTKLPLTRDQICSHFFDLYKLARSLVWTEEKLWLKNQLQIHAGGWCRATAIKVEFLNAVMHHPESYLTIEQLEHDFECFKSIELEDSEEERTRQIKLQEATSRWNKQIRQFLAHRKTEGVVALAASLIPKAFISLINPSLDVARSLGVSSAVIGTSLPVGIVMHGLQWAKQSVELVTNLRSAKRVDRVCYTKLRSELSPATATHVFAHTLGSVDREIEKEIQALDAHFVIDEASKLQTKQLTDMVLPLSHMREAWQFYRLQEGYDKLQDQAPEVLQARFKDQTGDRDLFVGLCSLEDKVKGTIDRCETELAELIGPYALRLVGYYWLDTLSHLTALGELEKFFPELSLSDREAIELLATSRLMLKARCSQIQQAIGLFKKLGMSSREDREEILIHLHAKLTATRKWSFDQTPWNISALLLTFEGQCGVLLSSIQVEKMAQALTHNKDVIFEAIMGGGKSWFGQTFAQTFARLMGFAVLMYPANVIQAGTDTAMRQGRLAYGQKPLRVVLHPAPVTEEDWVNRLMILRGAAEAKQPISVTPEDIQSLLLNWFGAHYLAHEGGRMISDRSLEAMSEMLSLLKSQGISIGDEAHVIYDPKKSLRLPLGFKSTCKYAYLEGMSLIWHWLSLDTTLMEDLQKQTCYNKPEEESLAKYSEKVAQRIEKMYEVEGLARFLCDMKYEPEGLASHPQYDLFCLYRGILAVCLPQALKGALDVNYGPHPHSPVSPVVPYRNSDCPLVDSIIKNPFEAFLKTYISVASHGVPIKEGISLILQMLQMESGLNQIKEFPGGAVLIQRIKREKKWKNCLEMAMRESKADHLIPIVEELAHDPLLVGSFISSVVAPNLEAWSMSLTCDPQIMAGLFARNIAGTGTAAIEGVYPLGMEVQRDVAASTDALITLLSKTTGVRSLKSDNPQEILNELLDHYLPPNTNVRVWLDGSALLHGIAMKKVAQAVGEKLKDSIDFVLYYEGETLMAWDIQRQESVLAQTISVDPMRRFTIYDEAHTVGADIPQGNVEALLFAGPVLQKILQEAYRERKVGQRRVASLKAGRPLGQSLSIVINASARAQFDHDPSVYDVVGAAMAKEIEIAKRKNFDAAIQKINAAIVIRACMQILETSSLNQRKKLAYQLAPLFVEYQKIDAKLMFGGIFEDGTPQRVLEKKSQSLLQLAQSLGVNCEGVSDQLHQIASQTAMMPDFVRISQDGNSESVGLEATVSLNLAQEQQQQQEQEMSVVTAKKIGYRPMDYLQSVSVHEPSWLSHRALPGEKGSTLALSGVPMFCLEKLMAHDQPLARFSDYFQGPIYVTNNLLPIYHVGIEGPAQLGSSLVRPCRSVLVYYDVSTHEIHSVVALAATDHEFWKSKIQQTAPRSSMRCVLWDIHEMCPIASYEKDEASPLYPTLHLKEMILKLKLMLGYMNFSVSEVEDELEEWLETSGLSLQRLIDLLRAILARRGYGTSCLEVALMRDLWELNLSSKDQASTTGAHQEVQALQRPTSQEGQLPSILFEGLTLKEMRGLKDLTPRLPKAGLTRGMLKADSSEVTGLEAIALPHTLRLRTDSTDSLDSSDHDLSMALVLKTETHVPFDELSPSVESSPVGLLPPPFRNKPVSGMPTRKSMHQSNFLLLDERRSEGLAVILPDRQIRA